MRSLGLLISLNFVPPPPPPLRACRRLPAYFLFFHNAFQPECCADPRTVRVVDLSGPPSSDAAAAIAAYSDTSLRQHFSVTAHCCGNNTVYTKVDF